MRRLLAVALALACAACTHGLLLEDHPLAGRAWDVRAGVFVEPGEMLARAAKARYAILGETHDNPEHHRLQLLALESLAAKGAPRALAMEQFDSEHQPTLDAALARRVDAEALADAGRFEREAWDWPQYRPLVEFALERGWPLKAANLSRSEARAIVADPSRSGLPPAAPEVRAALERDMVEGHCGRRPEAKRLAGMVEAQRARDARMARVLAAAGASVLITGNGHARRDRGVPLYLPPAEALSIALVEVRAGRAEPHEYLGGFATPASFDYLWFTARAARKDPCGG